METSSFEYHILVSFAGEDRKIVEEFCEMAKAEGIKVFYDKWEEEQSSLLGKDLYQYLDNLYQRKAIFCLIFISEHYKKKAWTRHELKSAQARAFSQNAEYILPIRLDDAELEGVRPTIGYVTLPELGIERLVNLLRIKLTDCGIDLSKTKEEVLKCQYAKFVDENLHKYSSNEVTFKRLFTTNLNDFLSKVISYKLKKIIFLNPTLTAITKSINHSVNSDLNETQSFDAKLISLYLYFNMPVKQDWEFVEQGAIYIKHLVNPILERILKMRGVSIPTDLHSVCWSIMTKSFLWRLVDGQHKEILDKITKAFSSQQYLRVPEFSFTSWLNMDTLEYRAAEKLGIEIRNTIWPFDNEFNGYAYNFNLFAGKELELYLNCWETNLFLISNGLISKEFEKEFMDAYIKDTEEFSFHNRYLIPRPNLFLTAQELEIKSILDKLFDLPSTLNSNAIDKNEIYYFAKFFRYNITKNISGIHNKEELIFMLIDDAKSNGNINQLKKDAEKYKEIREMGGFRRFF